jgi:hypothetical protein
MRLLRPAQDRSQPGSKTIAGFATTWFCQDFAHILFLDVTHVGEGNSKPPPCPPPISGEGKKQDDEAVLRRFIILQ